MAWIPAASAHGTLGGYRVESPHRRFDGVSGSEALGEGWYRIYALPRAENPWVGNGERCVRIGRHRLVLLVIGINAPPCTVERGTAILVIGDTGTCSTVEPDDFAVTAREQRRCVWSHLQNVTSITLAVDGGRPIDVQRPRYTTCSPQRSFYFPVDNAFDLPGGKPGTMSACGWVAWLTGLAPGHHYLRSEARRDGVVSHVWDPLVIVRR